MDAEVSVDVQKITQKHMIYEDRREKLHVLVIEVRDLYLHGYAFTYLRSHVCKHVRSPYITDESLWRTYAWIAFACVLGQICYSPCLTDEPLRVHLHTYACMYANKSFSLQEGFGSNSSKRMCTQTMLFLQRTHTNTRA